MLLLLTPSYNLPASSQTPQPAPSTPAPATTDNTQLINPCDYYPYTNKNFGSVSSSQDSLSAESAAAPLFKIAGI